MIVIVGAGIAGLTLAHGLSETGLDVVLIEKEEEVGGLARSFHYDGFSFDIGPHRFHTDYKEVMDFILSVLGEDRLEIKRRSGVRMFGKHFDWPLTQRAVLQMPSKVMLKAGRDLFIKKKARTESFQDYIVSRYGKTLFDVFFRPYTEKFLKCDCSDIHHDWARAGIDRAVIDKGIKLDDLFKVVKNVLLPPLVDTRFIYPKSGSMDVFPERLADLIKSRDGKIYTGSEVTAIRKRGRKIVEVEINRKTRIKPDMVLWSAPIKPIARLMGFPDPGLEYLSLIVCNVMVDRPAKSNYQWVYYGDDGVVFNRASFPGLFNERNAPAGKSGVVLEISCIENDDYWRNPERLRARIEKSMLDMKLIEKVEDIIDIKFERIPNVYPIYTMDYYEKLEKVMKELEGFENLRLIGRTGTFWYNNMDHSIKMSLEMADSIIRGSL